MTKKFIAILILALLSAPLAHADQASSIICIQNVALAAAVDNAAFAVAPYGGAVLTRAACYTDANATTPATLLFEDGAGNATTGTITCAENGANATWGMVTAGNTFVEGEPIVFDTTNAADAQVYAICAEFQLRD